jgi:arylformamidase
MTVFPAVATGLFGALLLVRRARRRAARDYQYSPSQWSNRLRGSPGISPGGISRGGGAPFGTPDEVVMDHCATVARGSAAVRAELLRAEPRTGEYWAELDVPHSAHTGTTSLEATVDIFYGSEAAAAAAADGADGADGGDVFVYIHGGYWQALSKRDSCFHARTVLRTLGCAAFVAVGYELCPNVPFVELVAQVKNAVALVLRKFPRSRVHVCGHSAGAHLGAVVMCTDWAAEYGLADVAETGRMASFILVSGIYDLRPIQASYVNDACRMTEAVAVAASPALLAPRQLWRLVPAGVPVIVAAGQHDSPAFRAQSKAFCEMLAAHTEARPTYVELAGEDHFTAMERMTEEGYTLTESVRVAIAGV